MTQSRKASLVESITNVMIGFWVALGAQAIIFPLFDVHVSASENLAIAAIFTVISIARSYLLRRIFNWFSAANSIARGRKND